MSKTERTLIIQGVGQAYEMIYPNFWLFECGKWFSNPRNIPWYHPFWINPRWSGPVSTIHHAAGHVFAVTRITFHHHRGWFENGHGDPCHRQLFMIGLLRRNDRRIRGQHEMNARVRDQIGLESWMCRSHKGAQKIYKYSQLLRGQKYDMCVSQNYWREKIRLYIWYVHLRNSVMSTFSAPSKPGRLMYVSVKRNFWIHPFPVKPYFKHWSVRFGVIMGGI